jgi:hypothetical protein
MLEEQGLGLKVLMEQVMRNHFTPEEQIVKNLKLVSQEYEATFSAIARAFKFKK